ncbi:MAG: putative Se/S carrier-like protein [Eubacteriales bacterium]
MENNTVIVLSSMTYAYKAQSALAESGIRSAITRGANVRRMRGCGYGIVLKTSELDAARTVLKSLGIKIIGESKGSL